MPISKLSLLQQRQNIILIISDKVNTFQNLYCIVYYRKYYQPPIDGLGIPNKMGCLIARDKEEFPEGASSPSKQKVQNPTVPEKGVQIAEEVKKFHVQAQKVPEASSGPGKLTIKDMLDDEIIVIEFNLKKNDIGQLNRNDIMRESMSISLSAIEKLAIRGAEHKGEKFNIDSRVISEIIDSASQEVNLLVEFKQGVIIGIL